MNSVSGKTFPTINPANGQKICDVQEGDKVGCGVKPSKISNFDIFLSPWSIYMKSVANGSAPKSGTLRSL